MYSTRFCTSGKPFPGSGADVIAAAEMLVVEDVKLSAASLDGERGTAVPDFPKMHFGLRAAESER